MERKINDYINKIICGDNVEVLREFPDECIDLTVTSPPSEEYCELARKRVAEAVK